MLQHAANSHSKSQIQHPYVTEHNSDIDHTPTQTTYPSMSRDRLLHGLTDSHFVLLVMDLADASAYIAYVAQTVGQVTARHFDCISCIHCAFSYLPEPLEEKGSCRNRHLDKIHAHAIKFRNTQDSLLKFLEFLNQTIHDMHSKFCERRALYTHAVMQTTSSESSSSSSGRLSSSEERQM